MRFPRPYHLYFRSYHLITKMNKAAILILCVLLMGLQAQAQVVRDGQNRRVASVDQGRKSTKKTDKDSEKVKAKTGIRTWTVDEMSGLTDSVAVDTMPHNFQNTMYTEGYKGFYSSLGNMGSPRQARVFTLRPEMNYYIFSQPFDFFLHKLKGWHFTNTFSPIANVTYHESGDSDDGEDRLIANYAVNVNKDIGLGFNIDYIYGRGYHDNQSTADFGFNLYGSVIKDKYKAHWIIYTNYLKTRENGGITDDAYVTDPQKFPSSYDSKEIPTMLNRVWNKMHYDGVQFNHRYSLGYHKVVKIDSAFIRDSIRRANEARQDSILLATGDTLHQKRNIEGAIRVADVARTDNEKQGKGQGGNPQNTQGLVQAPVRKDSVVFVPVTSVIHTIDVGSYRRRFIANEDLSHYYTNNFFGRDSVNEAYNNVLVSNYLALELSEGLNKYLSAGIRLFGKYDFNHYEMPDYSGTGTFNEHRATLGGQIFRQQSKIFNYLLTAQTSSDGDSWGEFELRGKGKLTVKFFGDTLGLSVRGAILNQKPTFFYRHYQNNFLWWDNDNLDKQFTTTVGATLESKKLDLRLSVDAYNIGKYTYFATQTTDLVTTDSVYHTLNTNVRQSGKNINLLVVALDKNFTFGPVHWDNSVVYQTTSDKEILPLPLLTLYSNLYLKFKIAHVLTTELGADIRYFTKYYAPTYSAALNQFANQDTNNLVKVGGDHPIINAYINFHLKHTRFYVMVSHLNYTKDGGTTFGPPHYPVNPLVLKFGLSWNFFN